MAAVLLALPVYGISNELFKLAVCRDNSVSLFQRKGARKLAERLNEMIAGRGRKKWGDGKEPAGGKRTADEKVLAGLGFADFTGEMEEGKTWFQSQKKERIAMTSHDGLKLVAYYLPAPKESRRVLILMHGYRNEGIVWDFSGLVKFYHEQGYHLLVPHQRAHGESEGEHICFGVKERYDLAQWAEYISRRFERRCSIFLSGISMGGATVLMAAGLLMFLGRTAICRSFRFSMRRITYAIGELGFIFRNAARWKVCAGTGYRYCLSTGAGMLSCRRG